MIWGQFDHFDYILNLLIWMYVDYICRVFQKILRLILFSASIENATYYLSNKSHDVLVGNSNSSSCSGSSSGGKSSAICKPGM